MRLRVSGPALIVSLFFHGLMIALVARTLSSQSERTPEPLPLKTHVVIIPPAPPPPVPIINPPPKKEMPKPTPKPKPTPIMVPKPVPVPITPREVVAAKPETPEPPRETATAPPAIAPSAPAAIPTPSAPPPAPAKTGVSIPAAYAAGNRKPIHPALSRRYGEQGAVMLRVFVNADGTAGKIEIKTSSGYPLLDEAAREAVQTWRFLPASVDGKPVGEWYQVPIQFKLQN